MAAIERTYSTSFSPGTTDYDLFNNKNVDWLSGPFVKVSYVVFLIFVWGLLHVSRYLSVEDCWTATNVLHGVVSQYFNM